MPARYIVEKSPKKLTHVLVYDDITEMAAEVAAMSRPKLMDHVTDMFDPNYVNEEWLGRSDLTNWNKIEEACHVPWKWGMDRLQTMRERLSHHEFAEPRVIRRIGQWRDSDGDFNYDRFTSGQDAFRSVARRDASGQQFVTLVVNTCANCYVSAEQLIWRGMGAIAACEVLEAAGYGVEIVGAISVQDSHYPEGSFVSRAEKESLGYREVSQRMKGREQDDFAVLTWVKRADQPIDEAALINAVSPWFFRTVSFGAFGVIPNRVVDECLGRSINLRPAHLSYILGEGQHSYEIIEGTFGELQTVDLTNRVLNKFSNNPKPEEEGEGESC